MYDHQKTYDLIGIGVGPFNLGLAALSSTIPNFDTLFFEKEKSFQWHSGMMLSQARLQVPFYADLVTLADPCHKMSYLSYLKASKKMFRFAIQENYCVKRSEYANYCHWVTTQLPCIQFDHCCLSISYANGRYEVKTNQGSYYSHHLVMGTGTTPHLPIFARQQENVFHSSKYLNQKEYILQQHSISLIGSGQSAAEIFYDLLPCYKGQLTWYTRSSGFAPMDYSKLNLELSTPEYIDHFFSLSPFVKTNLLKNQQFLYKGINQQLISDIYAGLVDADTDRFTLQPNCELTGIQKGLSLDFLHTELEQPFSVSTNVAILATGYHYDLPACIRSLGIQDYEVNRNYSLQQHPRIFVQNAEQHSHGFSAADLSLGPYRNSIILNSILGHTHFEMENNYCFQQFGLLRSSSKSKS